jgi:hypothetical protein
MKRLTYLVYLFAILSTAILLACKPPAATTPVIYSFEANPPTIAAGESATLSWEVSGATAVSIDQGIGAVALKGTRVVTPDTTTTYTLTASNSASSTTATTQVVVSGTSGTTQPPSETTPSASPPVVNYFRASPISITLGSSATLTWSVTNATSVTIEPAVGTFGPSGSTAVSPAGSTTYVLTATNSAGSTSATATVNVLAPPEPPPAPSFRVTDATVSVTPSTIATSCPYTFTCTVTITATAAGTVTYRWERSDGGYSPTQTMTFTTAGSQTAATGWPRETTGTHWVRVRVLTPNELVSNQASFNLTCVATPPPTPAFQVTNLSVSVSPNPYTGPCPAHFSCTVTITTNGPGTVTYCWVRSDGTSPNQTMVFTSAGSQTAQTGWSPPPGTASLHVEILSPNPMKSIIQVVQNNCH